MTHAGTTSHSVRSFEDELRNLESRVSHMGGAVVEILEGALGSLGDQNAGLARKSILADKEINLMEYNIESLAVRIFALRQPLASDLRFNIIAIKIASDLERMADLAKGIAKRVLATTEQSGAAPHALDQSLVQNLMAMGHFARDQLQDILQAYRQRDRSLAYQVWQRDSQLDAMNEVAFQTLVEQMRRNMDAVATWTHFLFIAKSIERIGDHVCNVAELINYHVTGLWPVDEWVVQPQVC